MSDRQYLLDAMADDRSTLRKLVFADWLEEHGEEKKAEFLRSLVAFNNPEGADDAECTAYKEAHRSVMKRIIDEGAIAGLSSDNFTCNTQTGQMDWKLTSGEFLDAGTTENLALFGNLTTVKFTELAPRSGIAVAASPQMIFLNNLEIAQGVMFDEACVERLAQSPHSKNIEALKFHGISADGFVAIGQSPHLEKLTALSVDIAFTVDPHCMRAFANSPHMRNLKDLSLTSADVFDEGARALANSPYIKLTKLALPNCSIGDAGARELARSPSMAGLTDLSLSRNNITTAGLHELANSPRLHNLTKFEVAGNEIIRPADYAENSRTLNAMVQRAASRGVTLDVHYKRELHAPDPESVRPRSERAPGPKGEARGNWSKRVEDDAEQPLGHSRT